MRSTVDMPRDRENGGKRTIGPINKSVIGGPRFYPEWLDWLLKVISRRESEFGG